MIADLALSYDAPSECPTQASLADAVRARAADGERRPGQSFEVRIERRAGFDGRLTIKDGDSAAVRALHAETCDELVLALALAIATALEPAEPPAPSPSPPPPPAPPPSPPAPTAAPPAAEPPPPPAPATRHLAIGAGAGPTGGLSPALAPELTLFGEYAWGPRALRGGVAVGLGPPIPADISHGLLRRAALRIDGCPLAWELGKITPSLCVTADVGLVFASGADTVNAENATRPWLAPGVAARVRWSIAPPLFVEIEGRAEVPLLRDQFYFRPSTDIYAIPGVVGAGAVLAGVRFW